MGGAPSLGTWAEPIGGLHNVRRVRSGLVAWPAAPELAISVRGNLLEPSRAIAGPRPLPDDRGPAFLGTVEFLTSLGAVGSVAAWTRWFAERLSPTWGNRSRLAGLVFPDS